MKYVFMLYRTLDQESVLFGRDEATRRSLYAPIVQRFEAQAEHVAVDCQL